ncbi:MAG: DUF3596 domain-containing protein [Synechococcaceae cyanobacterium SM2_3_1]|nr:DUF3596 domain-containing protein [Synechococcaceae cyanobacterium SM2_3_1]
MWVTALRGSQSPKLKAPHGRTSKGSVAILVCHGRLQLRFHYLGKRRDLSLGLPDTKTNCKAAELKAQLMKRDIVYGEIGLSAACKWAVICVRGTSLSSEKPWSVSKPAAPSSEHLPQQYKGHP